MSAREQALALGPPGKTAAAALETLRSGGLVAIAATETPFPEAMLCAAAHGISGHALNRMIVLGRGLTCVALPAARCAELGLRAPRRESGEPPSRRAEYLNTVEARVGVSTGISVADRTRTIGLLGDPATVARDLVRPGHVMPIRVGEGGVLANPGCAEAGLDLVTLAGAAPAAALCHVLDEEGAVADLATLTALAAREGIPLLSSGEIADLRLRAEVLVERVGGGAVQTAAGELETVTYRVAHSGAVHLAVLVGDVSGGAPQRVRVLVQDPLGDAIGPRAAVPEALEALRADGGGVLLYLASGDAAPAAWHGAAAGREPRALGGSHNAYAATQILRDLKIDAVRLG